MGGREAWMLLDIILHHAHNNISTYTLIDAMMRFVLVVLLSRPGKLGYLTSQLNSSFLTQLQPGLHPINLSFAMTAS